MSCRLSSTSCRAHGLSYWEASAVQLFGHQMAGRKSYNPKNKGKKSYQPILTFLSETREYVSGELRNGDRPTGVQIARHLESVFAALPPAVKTIYARADSGSTAGRRWKPSGARSFGPRFDCEYVAIANARRDQFAKRFRRLEVTSSFRGMSQNSYSVTFAICLRFSFVFSLRWP